jgi:hypothetical protein
MTTITTINQLPTGTLSDSMVFPAEQNALVGNATSQITAIQIRNYIAANVPALTMNVATGTPPFSISSTTLVPNLYVARANIADTTTNGLTTATVLAGTGDLTITGNYNNLTTTLATVNPTVGTFGGKLTNSFIIPSIQTNGKGLITSIANVFITTPQFQGMTTSSDITPTALSNAAVNLGTSTLWFNNAYINNLIGGTATGITSQGLTSNATTLVGNTITGNLTPSANLTYNLGSPSNWYNNLYVNSITSASSGGGLTVTGSIIPTANASYNLGSTTAWWNTVYGTAVHAQYADLAENYESDAEYAPGTVVVFGINTEVTMSTLPNDRRVAGVVSTAPAYLMNHDQPGVSVALQGRVPCRVIGNITRGDMLVTSQLPGVAMVNNDPRPGTVIGKALQSYSGADIGVIEVVVGRL